MVNLCTGDHPRSSQRISAQSIVMSRQSISESEYVLKIRWACFGIRPRHVILTKPLKDPFTRTLDIFNKRKERNQKFAPVLKYWVSDTPFYSLTEYFESDTIPFCQAI
ncbi:hypothetical protein J6590_012599 [Homalodisca vitripennis]|nr:hypothetical protein J6590_012599 [Homalodisca vitripennis]